MRKQKLIFLAHVLMREAIKITVNVFIMKFRRDTVSGVSFIWGIGW
ncbi:MAG: hypothetical protein NTZ20_02955 [Candidatus Levybacteria bacterium]|nr:hypothetical protein [Candidatus Levybacteria bacterium]